MRHLWVLAFLTATLSLITACAKPAPKPSTGDCLVLEVGGEQSSLREALREMGRPVGGPKRLRSPPPAPVTPANSAPFDAARQSQPAVVPDDPFPFQAASSAPPPTLASDQEWVTVRMERGDANLGDVAKRHLGSSRRYLDIQRWNGIDDAQAKRLRVGHELKLKRSELK